MNPHNIHVQPPNTKESNTATDMDNHNNSMMGASESEHTTAETTNIRQDQTMQVTTKLSRLFFLQTLITLFYFLVLIFSIFLLITCGLYLGIVMVMLPKIQKTIYLT